MLPSRVKAAESGAVAAVEDMAALGEAAGVAADLAVAEADTAVGMVAVTVAATDTEIPWMRTNLVCIITTDRVKVEISPYDLTRGRITDRGHFGT